MVEKSGTIGSRVVSTLPEHEWQEDEPAHEGEGVEREKLEPEAQEDLESEEESVTGPELDSETETERGADYSGEDEENAEETRAGREHLNRSPESGREHSEEQLEAATERLRTKRTSVTEEPQSETVEADRANQNRTAPETDRTTEGETEQQRPARQRPPHPSKGTKSPTRSGGSTGVPKHQDLQLQVEFQLGSLQIAVNELYKLRKGVCFNLGQTIPGPVDVLVNGQKIARGEMIQIGKRLGVRLTEVNL